MGKRIGFITHSVSGTDGVSLEIVKWHTVLGRMGHDCYFFGSDFYESITHDHEYVCSEAGYKTNGVAKILKESFLTDTRSEELENSIQDNKNKIKEEMYKFVDLYNIEILIIENAMAIPVNIPLGLAVKELLEETKMPSIAHNHDFYWERDKYTSINCVQDYLDEAFPVTGLDNLKHVVINTKGYNHLKDKLGQESDIVFNVGDFQREPFDTPLDKISEIRRDAGIANDEFFFLHPVRIIRRKNIEASIDFLCLWNKLHPGKKSKLVLSHPEMEDHYFKFLKNYAAAKDVEISFIGFKVSYGKYNLEDVYNASDFVFFTSTYEGFGNALIEAVYFKKPVLVYKYEVFVEDIEPTGAEFITMDSSGVTEETVKQVDDLLHNPEEMDRIVNKNFDIFAKNFSYRYLEKVLTEVLDKL